MPTDRQRFSKRRLAAITIVGLLVLVSVGLVWVVVTARMASHETDPLPSELTRLKSDLTHGRDSGAAQLVLVMQRQSAAAHAHTSGPAWWVASELPWVGSTVTTVRGATRIAEELSDTALPPAAKAGQLLNPSQLRSGPDGIDLQRLGEAASPLNQAAAATLAVEAQAQALSGSTLVSKLNSSRDKLVNDVTTFHSALSDLASAAQLLPQSLGGTGTRRYLMVFQTDAEMRGLGGLPGNYAILTAQDGHLHFVRFGSDLDFNGARAHAHLGDDFRREFRFMYGPRRPQFDFVNSDPSPNFPDAARLWLSMWHNRFHQHLDGAIATDPTALALLLRASGGVRLTDGTVINAADAVAFFENGIYSKFAPHDNLARKQYQSEAARAVATKLLQQPSKDLLATATALEDAVAQRRLLVYTTDRAVETAVQHKPLGGVLPQTSDPFVSVIINSVAGNKIGYYIHRRVHYQRGSCAASPATVTVTLHNSATSNVAPYVAGSFHLDPAPIRGSTVLAVSLYSTQGSTVAGVTLDGKPRYIRQATERGHPVAQVSRFFIRPGQTRTLRFIVNEPEATGPLITVQQPGVNPLNQTITTPHCAG